MCELVELGRAVQRHVRPDRLQRAAQLGAAEEVVRLLELVGGLGVPPDHEVGVGAQPRHVVRAADGDVLRGELVEQLLDLVGVAGAVLGQHVAQLEDGPQGVADDLVEVLGLLAGVRDLGWPVVGASSLMGLFSRAAVQALHRVRDQGVHVRRGRRQLVHGRVRARDAGRDADPVVHRSAHGEARAACRRARGCGPRARGARPGTGAGRRSQRVTRVATGAASRPMASRRSCRDTSTRSASSRPRISVSP